MWFRMPEGVSGISVELQSFAPDIEFEGRSYFRAPDHFAPRILSNTGFELVDKVPEGFPEDIPKTDPLRDGAIAELTQSVEALKRELGGVRVDLNATVAKAAALAAEKAELMAKLEAATTKIEELEEELEDRPPAPPPSSKKD
jgi:hypothetical protein